MACTVGLRPGEVRALAVGDVRLEADADAPLLTDWALLELVGGRTLHSRRQARCQRM